MDACALRETQPSEAGDGGRLDAHHALGDAFGLACGGLAWDETRRGLNCTAGAAERITGATTGAG